MFRFLKKIVRVCVFKFKYGSKLVCDFSVNIGADSEFEGMNRIHPNASFSGVLGFGSYIGGNAQIIGKVGKFTSIAPGVTINPGIHPLTLPYLTTSPAFFSTRKQNGGTFVDKQYFEELRYADTEKKYAVIIGNDCWIGQNAFIVGGVTIADGAVVLAGAVVTKDVAPYAILGGVPAKVLGYRFDNDDINFLLNFKWWEKDVSWLKENHHLLRDIDRLKRV